MQAGKLDQRVAFDQPVTNQDATGGEIVNWAPAFTLWASVEPLTGREQMLGGGIIAEGKARIRVRWSEQAASINAKWRARHGDIIYNLSSVAHLASARREIEIIAQSGANDG
jgi:SPP1 family predicted phage head-tail adaptor